MATKFANIKAKALFPYFEYSQFWNTSYLNRIYFYLTYLFVGHHVQFAMKLNTHNHFGNKITAFR